MISLWLGMISLILNSNGAVDDFVTTAVVAAAASQTQFAEEEKFHLSTIVLTNANCEPFSALSAHIKMKDHLQMRANIGLSDSRVWTPLPWEFRWDSNTVNHLSLLEGQSVKMDEALGVDGNQLFYEVLKESDGAKILVLGPLSTLVDVLKMHPEIENKISELHWMGGAIDVPGNINISPEIPFELLNDNAEWNAFSDPTGTAWIFKNTTCKLFIYPLDLSHNTFPQQFIEVLKKKKSTPYSKFVLECYSSERLLQNYRMWGIAAAAGIVCKNILKPPTKEKLRIETGMYQTGALKRDDKGREVYVYKEFVNNDPYEFYEAIASILSR